MSEITSVLEGIEKLAPLVPKLVARIQELEQKIAELEQRETVEPSASATAHQTVDALVQQASSVLPTETDPEPVQ